MGNQLSKKYTDINIIHIGLFDFFSKIMTSYATTDSSTLIMCDKCLIKLFVGVFFPFLSFQYIFANLYSMHIYFTRTITNVTLILLL